MNRPGNTFDRQPRDGAHAGKEWSFMDFERDLLEQLNRQTTPQTQPDFCDVAAKAITYKKNHGNENPPRKYQLKKRLGVLALAAALLLGIPGGIKGVDYLRAFASPYRDVYLAMKAYATPRRSFSLNFSLGAKSADTGEGFSFQNGAVAGSDNGSVIQEDTAGVSSEKSPADHSTTNTQVSGVDEGDILKNDGTYLYILSAKTGFLRIVQADEMKLVSEIEPYDEHFIPNELYITESRLAVVGMLAEGDVSYYKEDYRYYGYEKDAKTAVAVYDISDRAKPAKTGDYQQDGTFLSSRMVDETVYLLSNYWIKVGSDISVSNVEKYIPSVGPSGEQELIAPECIDILKTNPTAYTVISGISMNQPEKTSTRSVLGQGSVVYSSTQSVYVVSPGGSESDIIRFSIMAGQVEKSATGTVPGSVLNQFALDEREGYLRIATSARGNSLYVLSDKLSVVGKVTDLAPGEQIKSVRFMGKMGYVVTFRQTDPLFAIDLSDPKNPKLLGELKIPGFSTYMHPYDENTIIGIGFDADANTGITSGLKVSVFDVSDPANMKETQSYRFGQGGSFYSEATSDHKAVLFSAGRNLMVIPAQYKTEQGSEFNGALVFDLTGKKIRVAATVTHRSDSTVSEEAITVRRSAYIGQKLYTVSESMLMCVSLEDYKLLGTLPLASGNDGGPVSIGPESGETKVIPPVSVAP